MKYKHYSPDADVSLVTGDEERVIEKINSLVKEDKKTDLKQVLCAVRKIKTAIKQMLFKCRRNIETAGARLFDLLREFDALSVKKAYSETFDETGEGMAVMNRLKKAAGHKFIEA